VLLKVGELAKHAGLTVRTLHHYDEIGLLKPSGRSDSGYRLYSREDVARLHGIQALRQLGLALADIGAMLEKGGTPPGLIIDQQMRALDREIERATELRDHLGLLQHQLAKGNEPDMADWLDTLGLMKTYGKYFSAAELKTIFANWNLIENDWEPLVAAVREVMNHGFAADAPEVQPLAQRWMRLMLRWMDGNFDLIDRWGEMYEKEPSAAGRNGAPQADMIEFIRRAIDLRMSLLCKYLTLEEIRRFRHIPDEEWQEMAHRVTELMERGAAPESDAAQAMTAQWLALLDRLVGHDDDVRARLLAAQASEPLLQAGSMMPAPARAYLRRCMAQGLTLT
jgi:DNA-binding transcriptional MerR regulator